VGERLYIFIKISRNHKTEFFVSVVCYCLARNGNPLTHQQLLKLEKKSFFRYLIKGIHGISLNKLIRTLMGQ